MPPSPPSFSPTSPRRESIPENAAFPSVRPLGETLPSPPQYTRNLPPGQRRLGPQPVVAAGPSRVVGFQPISRTISARNVEANAASTVGNTQQQSALTSGRPQVKSSTSFGDLNPPKDIHDEFKYLHLGDRKMKMVITRGVGPPVGKFGKEGKGKPRRVKVDEVGGRVEGFVEVGKVDGCVGLDLTVSAHTLSTLASLTRCLGYRTIALHALLQRTTFPPAQPPSRQTPNRSIPLADTRPVKRQRQGQRCGTDHPSSHHIRLWL